MAAAQTTRALPGANTTTTTTSTHNNDANVFCDAILCTENASIYQDRLGTDPEGNHLIRDAVLTGGTL